MQRSVRHLKFRNGLIKLKGTEIIIDEGDFIGPNGQLTAGKLSIKNSGKNLSVVARKVSANQLTIEDNSRAVVVGLQWQEADIKVSAKPSSRQTGGFDLKNILGANTKFVVSSGQESFNAFFATISADRFLFESHRRPVIDNLNTTGKSVSFVDRNLQLTIDRFAIADHRTSEVTGLEYKTTNSSDSTSILLPQVVFTPDVSSIVSGKIITGDVRIVRPVINIKSSEVSHSSVSEKQFPEIVIGKIIVQQPEVYVAKAEGKQVTKLTWNASDLKSNFFQIDDFKITGRSTISAGKVAFWLNNFSLTTNGKKFNSGQGEIKATINKFYVEPGTGNKSNWNGVVADLHAKGFTFDSIGKKLGKLDITMANLSHLSLNSASFTNLRQLIKENKAFSIKEITGSYTDSEDHYQWLNANYDRPSKTFSVDSFAYHPVADRDSFAALHPYQTDYVTLQTASITMDGFDPDRYLIDTVIDASRLTINKASMSVFRDKRLPFRAAL